MSRRKAAVQRSVQPDPVYHDEVVARFVNKIMIQGKKSVAQRLLYGAFDEIKSKLPQEEPLSVLKKAIENVKPGLEVRSRRVGGATYQVPVDVRPVRRLSLAMNWLIQYSRSRGEKDFAKRLAGEVLDAYNGRGNSIKKRDDVHRMAESNKAFSHYNW